MHSIVYRMGLWEFFPIFRYLDRNLINTFNRGVNELLDIIKRNINEHKSQFDINNIRDFCDSFIKYQKEAMIKGKGLAHLTNENIARSIFDLFIGK